MPTAGTVISGHENSLRKIISGGCRLTFTEQMETPAHSGAESGAILGFNGLLRLSEDSVKSLFVRDGQIGKNLAVQIDIGGFQAFHKAGIGQTAVADGSGNTGDPKTAELSLPTLTVAVFILPSLVNSILGVAEEFAAETAETLGTQENALTTLARGRSISGTWHSLFLFLS
jgi:hypothetical protein